MSLGAHCLSVYPEIDMERRCAHTFKCNSKDIPGQAASMLLSIQNSYYSSFIPTKVGNTESLRGKMLNILIAESSDIANKTLNVFVGKVFRKVPSL